MVTISFTAIPMEFSRDCRHADAGSVQLGSMDVGLSLGNKFILLSSRTRRTLVRFLFSEPAGEGNKLFWGWST